MTDNEEIVEEEIVEEEIVEEETTTTEEPVIVEEEIVTASNLNLKKCRRCERTGWILSTGFDTSTLHNHLFMIMSPQGIDYICLDCANEPNNF